MNWLRLPFEPRYLVLTGVVLATVVCAALSVVYVTFLIPTAIAGVLTLIGIHDLFQTRHSILRSHPLAAHMRFLFEKIRPEIRQYLIEDDLNGTPFPRKKR